LADDIRNRPGDVNECRKYIHEMWKRYREVDSPGKLTSPARRRQAVEHAQVVFDVSERRVCRALEQPCSTQRHQGKTLMMKS